MASSRLVCRIARPPFSPVCLRPLSRSFTATTIHLKNDKDRAPSTAAEHRAYQTSKPANQFIPNTTSTLTNDFPSVGAKAAPPELLSSVAPDYKPADPYPGRVEHLTGGTQQRGTQKAELGVGEMEGITFKVEPIYRTGEDTARKRARLLCMPMY